MCRIELDCTSIYNNIKIFDFFQHFKEKFMQVNILMNQLDRTWKLYILNFIFSVKLLKLSYGDYDSLISYSPHFYQNMENVIMESLGNAVRLFLSKSKLCQRTRNSELPKELFSDFRYFVPKSTRIC